MNSLSRNCVAFAAGALTHVLYFRTGEHHLHGWRYVQIYLFCILASTRLLHRSATFSLLHATSVVGELGLLRVGGTWIAGNTTIFCPQYVLGRNDTIYPSAAEFLPEGWSNSSRLLDSKTAFTPFSIGKNLALMEIRILTAKLIATYDTIAFAPGEDGTRLLEDSYEHFTMACADLELVFRRREDEKQVGFAL